MNYSAGLFQWRRCSGTRARLSSEETFGFLLSGNGQGSFDPPFPRLALIGVLGLSGRGPAGVPDAPSEVSLAGHRRASCRVSGPSRLHPWPSRSRGIPRIGAQSSAGSGFGLDESEAGRVGLRKLSEGLLGIRARGTRVGMKAASQLMVSQSQLLL